MRTRLAESVFEAEADADLVVKQGRVTRNRFGACGDLVPLPDGYYELTQIEPIAARDTAECLLVRVYSPHRGHPYEGMIICRDHLRQIFTGDEQLFALEKIPADLAAFWNHRCLMCGVAAVPDRLCENEHCRPLHPQWPAVYCKSACALEDV